MGKLRVLDLFSGIGGFSLGLERTGGFETVAFCEIEEFPRRVLAKHWPDVPQYHDVTELAGWIAEFDCQPNVICGGFPCQDISAAGNREGIDGIRSGLWSHYARLIRELRPDWVIVENVAALLVRGLDRVLGDLAEIGYDAWWDCVRASALGYPHERDRLWLVAYPAALRRDEGERSQERWRRLIRARIHGVSSPWAQAANNDEIRSGFIRIVDGLPDHAHRLGGLGNAIIPEFAELIGNAILASLNLPNPERQPFDHAPCCLPDAERLTSAGLVSFHEPMTSAGDA